MLTKHRYYRTNVYDSFGWYLIFLSVFHLSEYLATAWTNPNNLTTDSFVLNHSTAYHVAAAASWLEFAVELYFLPELKMLQKISVCGVVICAAGETLRKLAMYHAGVSFNHIVQSSKQSDHTLVTSGVFSLCRHPSYVGYFWYSIGTQVILCNPLCLIAYAIVSWKFFQERVYYEEYALLNFFGKDYLRYKRSVPSGLPFISGYNHFTEETIGQ